MATFVRKAPPAARRKRHAEEGAEDASVLDVVLEAKEQQKLRERPEGVSTVELLVGRTLPKEAELLGEVDPTTGLKKKTDEEKEEADKGKVTKALDSAFTAQVELTNPDRDMMKYVEDQLARARPQSETEDTRTEYEKMVESLYQVPEHLQVQAKTVFQSRAPARGMYSNQILSGIPEVDLGVEAKMKNIEETELARSRLLERGHERRRGGFDTGHVSRDIRFGSNREIDHSQIFDAAKKKAFDQGLTDHAVYSKAVAEQKPRPDHHKTASDDYAFQQFRKRNR